MFTVLAVVAAVVVPGPSSDMSIQEIQEIAQDESVGGRYGLVGRWLRGWEEVRLPDAEFSAPGLVEPRSRDPV